MKMRVTAASKAGSSPFLLGMQRSRGFRLWGRRTYPHPAVRFAASKVSQKALECCMPNETSRLDCPFQRGCSCLFILPPPFVTSKASSLTLSVTPVCFHSPPAVVSTPQVSSLPFPLTFVTCVSPVGVYPPPAAVVSPPQASSLRLSVLNVCTPMYRRVCLADGGRGDDEAHRERDHDPHAQVSALLDLRGQPAGGTDPGECQARWIDYR